MTCPILVSPQCVTKDFPSAAEFIIVPRHVSHYHNQFKLDLRLKKACFVISNKEIFDSAIFDCWFWSSDQLFEVMNIRILYLAGARLNACLSIMPGGFQLLLFSNGFLVPVHCENLLGFPVVRVRRIFSLYTCVHVCAWSKSLSAKFRCLETVGSSLQVRPLPFHTDVWVRGHCLPVEFVELILPGQISIFCNTVIPDDLWARDSCMHSLRQDSYKVFQVFYLWDLCIQEWKPGCNN